MVAVAEQEHTIPGTHRTRVAAETMRDWLQLYRRGGFDALYPKPRADRGRPRQINRIAHYALSAAALDQARPVNSEHLQRALDELRP